MEIPSVHFALREEEWLTCVCLATFPTQSTLILPIAHTTLEALLPLQQNQTSAAYLHVCVCMPAGASDPSSVQTSSIS